MNKSKNMDILRKRNAQIQDELNRLKKLYSDYEQIKHINQEYEKHDPNFGEKRIGELISDLEVIKKEWLDVLEELKNERDEYKELMKDMREVQAAFKL